MKYTALFIYRFRFILIITATLLLSGCESQEAIDEKLSSAITFYPTIDGEIVEDVSTRVADIDLKASGFTVCGYESTDGLFDVKAATTYPTLFKNKANGGEFQSVTFTDGKFVTKERPWVAKDGNYLTFFAWSDYLRTSSVNGVTGHSDASKAGYPWIDIAVSNDIASQPDIVIARSMDLSNNALISAIDLQFKHLLSKISFTGFSSSGTGVKINKCEIKYSGATKSKARFDFTPTTMTPFDFSGAPAHNSSQWYPLISGDYPAVTAKNDNPATAQLLGSMVQIPQDAPDGFITVKVAYQIKGYANVIGPEITREISIKEMKLEQGYHYILALDFVADQVQVSVNSITDWNEKTSQRLPIVAGPKGDVLLWLDAGDAPYTLNGVDYWLDRSGYNRHCKIVNSSLADASKISYVAADKVYKFEKTSMTQGWVTSHIELPDLGMQKEITMQLLLKSYEKTNSIAYRTPFIYTQTPLNLEATVYNIPSDRQLFFHIYEKIGSTSTGAIQFDYSQASGYERMTSDAFTFAQQNVFSLITARRKTGFKSIARNASNIKETNSSIPERAANLKYGYFGGDFDGEIKMLKIMSRSIEYDQIESDYLYFKKLHKLPDDPIIPQGKLPTNNDQLIAYLDAYDEPYIIKGTYYPTPIIYWRDRTGNGNHLEIFGYKEDGTGDIAYDATNHYYQFKGNSTQSVMKFIKSFGALDNFSVEFGLVNEGVGSTYPIEGTTSRVLIHFSAKDGVESTSDGFIWYFPNDKNNLPPYYNGQLCAFNDAPSSANDTNTWGIGRSTTQFYARRAGIDGGQTISIGSYAPKLTYCYIGNCAAKTRPFKGKIRTIRIYKRAITQDERTKMKDEVRNGIPNTTTFR